MGTLPYFPSSKQAMAKVLCYSIMYQTQLKIMLLQIKHNIEVITEITYKKYKQKVQIYLKTLLYLTVWTIILALLFEQMLCYRCLSLFRVMKTTHWVLCHKWLSDFITTWPRWIVSAMPLDKNYFHLKMKLKKKKLRYISLWEHLNKMYTCAN